MDPITYRDIAELMYGSVSQEITRLGTSKNAGFLHVAEEVWREMSFSLSPYVGVPDLRPILVDDDEVERYHQLTKAAQVTLKQRYEQVSMRPSPQEKKLQQMMKLTERFSKKVVRETRSPPTTLREALKQEAHQICAGLGLGMQQGLPIPLEVELRDSLAEIYAEPVEYHQGKPWEHVLRLWREEHGNQGYNELAALVASKALHKIEVQREFQRHFAEKRMRRAA